MRSPILAAAAIVTVVSAARAQQTADLTPKFEVGAQSRYVMEISSRIEVRMPDAQEQTPPGTIRTEMGLTLHTVAADPEEGATVELIFDSLKCAMDMAGIEVDFDSTKNPAPDDVFAGALKGVVGTKLTLHTDAEGAITKVDGGGSLAGPVAGQLLGGAKPKDAFGPIFSIKRGGGVVRVGESWTNEDEISASVLGNFRMITEHRVRTIRRGQAHVVVSGRAEPAEGAEAMPVQIRKAQYDGSYIWDTAARMLASMTLEKKTSIEATLPTGAAVQDSTSTIKITRRP